MQHYSTKYCTTLQHYRVCITTHRAALQHYTLCNTTALHSLQHYSTTPHYLIHQSTHLGSIIALRSTYIATEYLSPQADNTPVCCVFCLYTCITLTILFFNAVQPIPGSSRPQGSLCSLPAHSCAISSSYSAATQASGRNWCKVQLFSVEIWTTVRLINSRSRIFYKYFLFECSPRRVTEIPIFHITFKFLKNNYHLFVNILFMGNRCYSLLQGGNYVAVIHNLFKFRLFL